MPKGEGKKRTKSVAAKASTKKDEGPRLRKATRRQARAQAKKELRKRAPLPGSFKLVRTSFATIAKFWKPLLGIVLVYSLLNLLFTVGAFGELGNTLDGYENDSFSAGASGFSNLLAHSGANTDSSFMQSLLFILETLVIVWALRHLLAGKKIKVKEAYYQSMAPLIPFMLVVLVIILQLIPLSISTLGLAVILMNGIAQSVLLGIIFTLVFVLLGVWSIYMLSSSIFAAYIVTLPNIQPRYALKSAKNLVKYRRFTVLRKVLFLPIFTLVLTGLVIVPLIMFASFLVVPMFFVLSMLSVLFGHTYLYGLYKGMLA